MNTVKMNRLLPQRWLVLLVALCYATTGQPEQPLPDNITERANQLIKKVEVLEKRCQRKE